MADIQRLNRTMAHIEANLPLWKQTQWKSETECGTAYCFAGWALQLEGIRICGDLCDGDIGFHVHRQSMPDWVVARISRYMIDPVVSVHLAARAILDLTPHQSWALFCGDNSLELLQSQVRTLTRTEPDNPQQEGRNET